MPTKAKSPTTAPPPANAYYDVDAYLHGASRPTVVCYCRVSSAKQRGDLERQVAQMRELYPDAEMSPTSPVASTGSAKDCSPYWSDCIGAISSMLWLPIGTDWPGSALNSSSGWSYRTAAQSWFSTSRMPAPSRSSPRIYSSSSTRSVAGCTDSGATERQSHRIRVYPNSDQKTQIATWLEASRWVYNLTVEVLQSGIPAACRHIAGMIMAELRLLHPEWESVPYQVKRTAVRDACRAMSNVKTFNRQLAADRARGERLGEDIAQLRFRSRKNPRQSCYIPDDAVTEHGVYHTILGPLRMAEAVPAGQKECRLVKERGLYWLVVPHPAQCDTETPSGDGVVALDPGVRTFLTYFSETDCGKIGHRAFGRIQRHLPLAG